MIQTLAIIFSLAAGCVVAASPAQSAKKQKAPSCFKTDQPVTCNISDLRPTQFNAGMEEVEAQSKKAKENPQQFKNKNPAPVVVGPDGKLFVLDHHHHLLALAKASETTAICLKQTDLSSLSTDAFWKEMIKRGWVYLKDKGVGKQPNDLPASITALGDDPYRTFAKKVEEQGGFDKKPCVLYEEFIWADLFRTHPEISLKDEDQAIQKAVEVAKSAEACALPGFKGNACK
jgi:hypothetical protein